MAKAESEAGFCYTLVIHCCFLKSHTETKPWALRIGLASPFPVLISCVPWPPGSLHLTLGLTSSRGKVGSLSVKQDG